MLDPDDSQATASQLRCAMCSDPIPPDPEWSDADARAEAEAKGIDPDDAGVVCDDCYAKTPWGRTDPGAAETNDEDLCKRIAELAARILTRS